MRLTFSRLRPRDPAPVARAASSSRPPGAGPSRASTASAGASWAWSSPATNASRGCPGRSACAGRSASTSPIPAPAYTATLALTLDDRPRGRQQFTRPGDYVGSRLDEVGTSRFTDVHYRDDATVDFTGMVRLPCGTGPLLRPNDRLGTPERRTLREPPGRVARRRCHETYGRPVASGARRVA
jgi:hypothetical protein